MPDKLISAIDAAAASLPFAFLFNRTRTAAVGDEDDEETRTLRPTSHATQWIQSLVPTIIFGGMAFAAATIAITNFNSAQIEGLENTTRLQIEAYERTNRLQIDALENSTRIQFEALREVILEMKDTMRTIRDDPWRSADDQEAMDDHLRFHSADEARLEKRLDKLEFNGDPR